METKLKKFEFLKRALKIFETNFKEIWRDVKKFEEIEEIEEI